MTCPHFLYCDQKFIKDVDGVTPDYEKHQTMVYIEPLTGILMKANKRIQFNTQLFKDERVTITKNLPEIMYPLFWVDEVRYPSSTQSLEAIELSLTPFMGLFA